MDLLDGCVENAVISSRIAGSDFSAVVHISIQITRTKSVHIQPGPYINTVEMNVQKQTKSFPHEAMWNVKHKTR